MMVPTSSSRSRQAAALLARGGAVLAGAFLLSVLVGFSRRGVTPGEAPPSIATTPADSVTVSAAGAASFDASSALLKLKLDRAEAILGFSARYQVPADLATAIYDIALQEGIDPQLAFRLVKVESNFKVNARSNRDAIGYTQVQVPTARFYDKTITEARLYERDTNLRIGFRFLRDLLRQYRHDYELALLAYNRGPARVNQIVAEGGNPSNGYENAVLKGYAPKRVTREMQQRAKELGS
jgi:soluble lytic murein transglycosylase-like protein